jgi:hypothetical protein
VPDVQLGRIVVKAPIISQYCAALSAGACRALSSHDDTRVSRADDVRDPCHTFFTTRSPLRCRSTVEEDMQTRTADATSEATRPVVLRVRGDEWRLWVRGVTPAGDEFFVELEVAGPSVCRVLVRTRRMVRGQTARQMLETVCEWLLRRRAGEDHAVLELPAAVA